MATYAYISSGERRSMSINAETHPIVDSDRPWIMGVTKDITLKHRPSGELFGQDLCRRMFPSRPANDSVDVFERFFPS